MNYLDQLLKVHSKHNSVLIAEAIGNSSERLGKLMPLYFSDDQVIAARAAWVISCVATNHPDLFAPWLKKICHHILKPGLHDAVRRNGAKVLELSVIPKRLLGVVTDTCFKLLAAPAETIATRCYCMTVLEKICRSEPDLRAELKMIINDAMPFASAGFRSRSIRTLKAIGQMDSNSS